MFPTQELSEPLTSILKFDGSPNNCLRRLSKSDPAIYLFDKTCLTVILDQRAKRDVNQNSQLADIVEGVLAMDGFLMDLHSIHSTPLHSKGLFELWSSIQ
jgi:hypothetical protein